MTPRTMFLSRLIGLYCVFAALSMVIRKQAIVEMVTALLHDSPLMFILGVFTLIAGLAMILAHNVWAGGAPAVIVTLVGWITLIKGLMFLFVPPAAEADFFLKNLHYEQYFYFYMTVTLAIGIYLTYSGFTARSHS